MRPLLAAYHQAYSGLPREIWALSTLLFVNRCGTMVLPFLTIYLAKVKGFEPHDAVLFLSVYGVGGVFGALLGGRLSQSLGPLRTYMVSLVLQTPLLLCLPAFADGYAIGAALFCLSIVGEMGRPAVAIATTDLSPPELLPKSFALNRLAANFGFSIGPAIGGVLAAAGFWESLFWVNAAATAATAAATAWWFGLREAPHAAHDRETNRGLSGPWSDGHYLAFLTLQFLSALVFFQMMSTYPIYLSEQLGLSEDRIGFLFVINTALIVLFEMVLTDRLRKRSAIHVMSLGVCLLCLGFGGMVLGGGAPAAAALVVVWTIGEMLSAPFGITYAAQRAAGHNRSAYLGLNAVTFSAAAVGAPLVGGMLYSIDPHLVWWCCLALAGLLPLGFWTLARQEAQQSAATATKAPGP